MHLWPTSVRLTCGVALSAVLVSSAAAVDRVTVRRDGKQLEVVGRSLVTAQDGGRLLLARDGQLWLIPPEEQVGHTSDGRAFVPFSRDEMNDAVRKELPQGFRTFSTTHYLIFYDTSLAYAQWCGSLFERLYLAFTNYWTRQGLRARRARVPAGGRGVCRPGIVLEILAIPNWATPPRRSSATTAWSRTA